MQSICWIYQNSQGTYHDNLSIIAQPGDTMRLVRIRRYPKNVLQLTILIIMLFFLMSQSSLTVQAATLLVTKIEDTNDNVCDQDCSLREAIKVAVNGDTIRFATDLLDKTIVLSGTELLVDKNLTIQGLGSSRLTISGNQQSRVFHIPANATVTMSGMRIVNGFVSVPLDNPGGGGILNQGTLVLSDVFITNNRVVDAGGGALGGGIHNEDGTLTVRNSTISTNIVEDTDLGGCFGGGISSSGDTNLYNVTVSNNQALDNGNWCFGAGIDHVEGDLNMAFVTVADNVGTANGGQVLGGGLSSAFGFIAVRNTIFARNQPQNCDIYVGPTSAGYNLDTGATCNLATDTDQQNLDIRLDTLKNNGGSLPTNALLENSPAIDRIPNGINDCEAGVTTDARSAVRAGGENRGGPGCDIGAYEYASNQQPTALTTNNMRVEQPAGLPVWVVVMILIVGVIFIITAFFWVQRVHSSADKRR